MPTQVPGFVQFDRLPNSGVDFLGMGAVGERLIGHCFPGITNAQHFIKPYSFAAWVAWSFEGQMSTLASSGRKLSKPDRTLFKEFREKCELAFGWANEEVPGKVGQDRSYPSTRKPVEMRFGNAAFGKENNASWFNAATYGPSFSTSSGLGYLESRGTLFKATTLGVELAEELDARLRKAGAAYKRLVSLDRSDMGAADIEALAGALRLDKTTKLERQRFRDAFYDEASVGQLVTPLGRRSTTIALILRALKNKSPLEVESVRRALAMGRTSPRREIATGALREMSLLWYVLALRQLQRVAMERLLRWFEYEVMLQSGKWCDLESVLASLRDAIRRVRPSSAKIRLASALEKTGRQIAEGGGCFEAGFKDEGLDPTCRLRELDDLRLATIDQMVSNSLDALVLCAATVDQLRQLGLAKSTLELGGREAMSLAWLLRISRDHADMTLCEFLCHLIGRHVYAQHLYTATRKSEPGKNKFRFLLEESGLRLLIEPANINRQGATPDRIKSGLDLMADCGLIQSVGGGQFSAI